MRADDDGGDYASTIDDFDIPPPNDRRRVNVHIRTVHHGRPVVIDDIYLDDDDAAGHNEFAVLVNLYLDALDEHYIEHYFYID